MAAFELEDWYKAPVGRAEAAEKDAERLAAGLRWWACGQAKHISGGPPTLGCNCNACDALRTHDDLKKIGS